MNPEVLYSKFLEHARGDVRTAVAMMWAVKEIHDRGSIIGGGELTIWYMGQGNILLADLDRQEKLKLVAA